MNLQNAGLWELRYLQNFSSQQVLLTDFPIPSFNTPVLSDGIVKVKISSSTAKSNWTYSGQLQHCINLTNGEVNVVDGFSLKLRDSRILILKDIKPYFLRFQLPKYLTQATVSIFGFTGVVVDQTQPFILGL